MKEDAIVLWFSRFLSLLWLGFISMREVISRIPLQLRIGCLVEGGSGVSVFACSLFARSPPSSSFGLEFRVLGLGV